MNPKSNQWVLFFCQIKKDGKVYTLVFKYSRYVPERGLKKVTIVFEPAVISALRDLFPSEEVGLQIRM